MVKISCPVWNVLPMRVPYWPDVQRSQTPTRSRHRCHPGHRAPAKLTCLTVNRKKSEKKRRATLDPSADRADGGPGPAGPWGFFHKKTTVAQVDWKHHQDTNGLNRQELYLRSVFRSWLSDFCNLGPLGPRPHGRDMTLIQCFFQPSNTTGALLINTGSFIPGIEHEAVSICELILWETPGCWSLG